MLPTQRSKVIASELLLEYDHFDYREQRALGPFVANRCFFLVTLLASDG
jgi:hypothetical protein